MNTTERSVCMAALDTNGCPISADSTVDRHEYVMVRRDAFDAMEAVLAQPTQPQGEPQPLGALEIVDIARKTFVEFEGREMQFEGLMPWVLAACERVAKAAANRTSPQRAAQPLTPLTDECIEAGAHEAGYNVYKLTAFLEGARFAESAHGIGEQP
jgi:hypothetical protein